MTDRIMLVEDEMIVAMDVQQRLEALGYQVVAHAISGEEAIRKAQKHDPQLILMDIKIRGEMDGIQAAAKIRETQNVPVIYITAFSDESTLSRARTTEAFGYLIKPFEDRELRSAIEVALYKHKMEKKLRDSEERYALAARAANDGIWDWDLVSDQVYFSPRWKTSIGLPEENSVSQPQDWFERVHPEDIEILNQAIALHLQGVTPNIECEYRLMHGDGGYRWMLCRGLALFDDLKKPYRLAGSQTEISRRKQIEEQLSRRALYDDLTGLPNRALFLDRLQQAMEQVRREQGPVSAVLFLDIDHFKIVNDSLGHISGDELLVAFAQRLKGCMRPGDTVARFGGDEFAILLKGLRAKEEASQIADHIQTELHRPIHIRDQELFAGASIGIAFITANYQSTEELLRDVDTAMYHAKNNGRGRFELFDGSMRERTLTRLRIESEIRRGLHHSEFTLYYQPVYAIDSMELVGFEALIRWQHPLRGVVLPGEFINVAEETGLIIPLGEWALRTACKQAQAWHELSGKPLTMAVNLSALQFHDQQLLEIVRSALAESGLDPKLLAFELTESIAMRDYGKTRMILSEFQKLNLSIYIDDFGSGYSSFDHVRDLPTNTLKIDRSFIKEIKDGDSAIVAAIITMAHQLRLRVIAEGVETRDQLVELTKIHCDQVQGFLFGKGVPAEKAWEIINARQTQGLDS